MIARALVVVLTLTADLATAAANRLATPAATRRLDCDGRLADILTRSVTNSP